MIFLFFIFQSNEILEKLSAEAEKRKQEGKMGLKSIFHSEILPKTGMI